MITLESITKKLGFNPLRYKYCTNGWTIDDNWDSPFKNLTDEELDFIFNAALSDPECYAAERGKAKQSAEEYVSRSENGKVQNY